MKKIICFIVLLSSFNVFSQKKILDHPDFEIWNRIRSPKISAEGIL